MDKATDSQHAIAVDCPKCGTPQEVNPVTVLRPGAAAVTELFKGTLNRVACVACGARFVLDLPLVYRDDEERFLVYMTTGSPGAAGWRASEASVQKVTDSIFGPAGGAEPPQCRLVTCRRELIEKIAIHENGMDDRIIEYIKYQLMNHPNAEQRIDKVRHGLLFDFSADLDNVLSFIVCDRESGKPVAATHIPADVYREVATMLTGTPGMRDELSDLFPGVYVNVDRLV